MAGLGKLETTALGVTVFTNKFQIRGELRVAGNLQTYLNDEQKGAFTVYNAETIAFDAAHPGLGMAQEELIVLKSATQMIIFDRPPAQGALSFLPRNEVAIAYTDTFAIQAKLFMGSDVKLNDYVDSFKQQYFVVTDIKLYPLFQPRSGVVGEGPVGVIQRAAFRMFHKI